MKLLKTTTLPILLLCAAPLAAQAPAPADDHAGCPMHAEHMAGHHAGADQLDQRGDATMGFSHESTTHHFLITDAGGVIQVEANDPADAASRDQIRHHLAEIAEKFAAGDFSAPQAVHDRVMPGVPEMTARKGAITWRYEEIERGGRVVITTADPAARSAVHDFLKAQIADHRTGDPS
jgi:hypothetical protein